MTLLKYFSIKSFLFLILAFLSKPIQYERQAVRVKIHMVRTVRVRSECPYCPEHIFFIAALLYVYNVNKSQRSRLHCFQVIRVIPEILHRGLGTCRRNMDCVAETLCHGDMGV